MPRIVTSPNVLLTELNDGTGVLLDLESKFYFTLNRTGVFVWKRLADPTREHDETTLARELTRLFTGADEEAARRDVSVLLRELLDHGLAKHENA